MHYVGNEVNSVTFSIFFSSKQDRVFNFFRELETAVCIPKNTFYIIVLHKITFFLPKKAKYNNNINITRKQQISV